MKAVLVKSIVIQMVCVFIISLPVYSVTLGKKLIESSMHIVTAQQLRRDLKEMEKSPFDGLVVAMPVFEAPAGTPDMPLSRAFENRKWEKAWFKKSIEDLKACRSEKLTDIFLTFNSNPGSVDWFDDAGWKQIVDHFRIAAWVAKQSGAKGLMWDPEPYDRPLCAFAYNAQPDFRKHTFAEYCAKARERGRECMKAMAAEYPDMTIFGYYLESCVLGLNPWHKYSAAEAADPKLNLVKDGWFSLHPAFLDGWFDALPPKMKLVDGDEHGYWYPDETGFLRSVGRIKTDGQLLVSPENRSKYRNQVQVGFGLYIDNLLPGSRWEPEGNPTTPETLEKRLGFALNAADEYVWIWNEGGTFWPKSSEPLQIIGSQGDVGKTESVEIKSWEEKMPGITQALINGKDPESAEKRRLEAELAAKLVNGKAEEISKKDDYTNVPVSEEGSIFLSGTVSGSIDIKYPVKANERYIIIAKSKTVGEGLASINVSFEGVASSSIGLWKGLRIDQERYFYQPKDNPHWMSVIMEVTIDPSVVSMKVSPTAVCQRDSRDKIWFDDIHIYLIKE